MNIKLSAVPVNGLSEGAAISLTLQLNEEELFRACKAFGEAQGMSDDDIVALDTDGGEAVMKFVTEAGAALIVSGELAEHFWQAVSEGIEIQMPQ